MSIFRPNVQGIIIDARDFFDATTYYTNTAYANSGSILWQTYNGSSMENSQSWGLMWQSGSNNRWEAMIDAEMNSNSGNGGGLTASDRLVLQIGQTLYNKVNITVINGDKRFLLLAPKTGQDISNYRIEIANPNFSQKWVSHYQGLSATDSNGNVTGTKTYKAGDLYYDIISGTNVRVGIHSQYGNNRNTPNSEPDADSIQIPSRIYHNVSSTSSGVTYDVTATEGYGFRGVNGNASNNPKLTVQFLAYNFGEYKLSTISERTFVFVGTLQTVSTSQTTTSNQYNLPGSVTTIGLSAFQNTGTGTGLTNPAVYIPDSVTSIAVNVFYQAGLASIELGTGLLELKRMTFGDCPNIGNIVFKGLNDTTVNYNGTNYQGYIKINQQCFYNQGSPVIKMPTYKGNNPTILVINNNTGAIDSVITNISSATAGVTTLSLAGSPTVTFANATTNICFPAGTVISLDQGDVEIQNVDTKKHTLNGKPILFVTKTEPNKPDVVCFEKDAFAPNVPSQRFECSRAHGIEYNGVRKMAEDWVDADQIHFVPNTHKFLYCLLLETHEMMDVYNIKAETLNPVRKVAQMYFAQLRKEKESC